MFNKKKLKSDYSTLDNNKKNQNQSLPNGYPCTFNTDCQSPSVCQFNVCTINIGGNETETLSNICKGMSVKDCAKEMQKEREKTEVQIYVPPSSTGDNGGNTPKPNSCKYDNECSNKEICFNNVCVNKSNYPLIARQKRLKSSNLHNVPDNKITNFDENLFYKNKKTPLDRNLNPYEMMFLANNNNNNINNTENYNKLYDDYKIF
jgi:hypothetical protein